MSKRDWKLYFEDILECIRKIENYTAGISYDEFSKDSKTVDAVVRNLEVIGEAGRQIQEDIKKRYEYVPWKRIVGLRNRIIHEYFGVDMEIIWYIISEELDELKKGIERALMENP